MRAINSSRLKLGAVAVAGASLFAAACGSSDFETARAQTLAAGGAPVVISCQPNERAVVRPAQMNGAVVSQVECAPATPAVPAASVTPQPVAYQTYAPAAQPVALPSAADDTRIVQTSYPVRTVEQPQIETRRPVKQGRTWKKSAVIIGSSAGIGAGVGAAMGGKKGALIGAAIGGGGAAIWDQVTRKK
jgi:hypothetical protein